MAVEHDKVQEKLNSGETLNEHEVRFLQDRGQLPDEYERVPVVFNSLGGTVTNDPTAVLANMTEQHQVNIEDEVKRRVEAELQNRAMAAQHETIVANTPHTGDVGIAHPQPPLDDPIQPESDDDDPDGVEDYEGGWNNDTRRAELAKRGLSTDGTKDELIARLVADDAAEDDDEDEE